MRRFVLSHGIVHRVHTHQSQRSASEVRGEAQDWMQTIRPMLFGNHRNQDYIINMDQTPIFFSMVPRTTLNTTGARTVNVRTSTGSTMRVTATVTLTAGGDMLPPLLVFKGKPGGRIEREFSSYHAGGFYCVQEKAWMHEPIMLIWVEQILKPYIENAPVGVEPVLFLDCGCPLLSSVINAIYNLGVYVEHLPFHS